MKKLISKILIGSAILSSMGGAALAGDIDSTFKNISGEKNKVFMKADNTTNIIDTLLNDGTITQEEATKWKDLQDAKESEIKAEMEKIQAMTEEEKTAYFEAKKAEREQSSDTKDFKAGKGMDALVEEGILSEEKVDAINEKIREIRQEEKEANFENRLSTLVGNSIITEEEADKWRDFQDTKESEIQTEMEKIQAMTEEEKTNYFEAKKAEREQSSNTKDFKGEKNMNFLVEEGVLSQDSLDKLTEFISNAKNN